MCSNAFKHIVCRNAVYLHSSIQRFNVPDEFVEWITIFPGYRPLFHEAPTMINQSYADPKIGKSV